MDTIIPQTDSLVASTYARLPVVFERGRGTMLWDTAGRRYVVDAMIPWIYLEYGKKKQR